MHWTELIVLEKKKYLDLNKKMQPLTSNMFGKSEILTVGWVLLVEVIQLNV